MKLWCVYIVKCSDNTYYTGISNDLESRIATHNTGKGAKYTATRTPVELIWFQPVKDRSAASKYEAEIKKFSRKEKEALVKGK